MAASWVWATARDARLQSVERGVRVLVASAKGGWVDSGDAAPGMKGGEEGAGVRG